MNKKLQNYSVNKKNYDVVLIISKFKFIAKMKGGEKMNVDGLSLVADNWFTSFFRTLNKTLNQSEESKDKTLTFIEELYEEAKECANALSKEDDIFYTEIGLMLIEAMKEGKNGGTSTTQGKFGVEALLNTYSKDKMFISKVETFLKVTEAKIQHLEALYKDREKNGDEF